MQNFEENLASRVNGSLQPLLGVTVTVKTAMGLLATIYSDNGATTQENPMETDSNGRFGFYAANGDYVLTFSGPQIQTYERPIDLYDPDDAQPLTLAQAALPSAASRVGFQADGDGAQGRTVENKLRETVSVADYDSGTTDAGLSSAIATAGVGGTVLVPPGAYTLAADVNAAGGHVDMRGATLAGPGKLLGALIDRRKNGRREISFGAAGQVLAIGRNSNNAGAEFQGLQVGGGDSDYGTDGTLLGNDGHASWLRFQPSKNESPVEMLLYPTAAQGIATATSGTNQVARVTGSAFTAAWIGKKFYLGDTVYRVASVTNADSMAVTTLGGGAVSFGSTFNETFHVAYIKGAGICNVSGSTVTRTSGDPFITFFSLPSFVFKINGITRTVSASPNTSTYTLSAAPGDVTGTPYTFECDINDQLSTLRVQKLLGSNEENVSLYARYDGYWLASQFAGSGKYRPVILSTGEVSTNPARQMNLYPNGDMTMGGAYNDDALRILGRSGVVANRFEIQAATAGFRMALRARGEANAGMAFDVAGTGDYLFTGGSFARSLFRITGNVSADTWPAVDANIGFAAISAAGATNSDMRIVGRGTGGVDLRDGAGASKVRVNTTGLGFFGTTPAAKPTVSGSRGGNAALASLITALAALGLVTDSTSA